MESHASPGASDTPRRRFSRRTEARTAVHPAARRERLPLRINTAVREGTALRNGAALAQRRRAANGTATQRAAMNRKRILKARNRAYGSAPRRPTHSAIRGLPLGKGHRAIERGERAAFIPPEDWYEPRGQGEGYRIIVQPPGAGYRHVLTAEDVRHRLAQLPEEFVRRLEVVQFSRITRKKQSFPCYGMQWGTTIYLYPVEESLVEHYPQAPRPTQRIEASMYGGRWEQDGAQWRLRWSESSIRDFYLNNVLIHELGHLLDERNSSFAERERFAEWFAMRHGYLASGGRAARTARPRVVRRHHAK